MIIQHLEVTNENYAHAIKVLKETYSNKLVSTITTVEKLNTLSILNYTLESVHSFRAQLEANFAHLGNASLSAENNSTAQAMLVAGVLAKIPPKLNENLNRSAGDKILDGAR